MEAQAFFLCLTAYLLFNKLRDFDRSEIPVKLRYFSIGAVSDAAISG